LQKSVERFLRVAKPVPPTRPATSEQILEGRAAFEGILAILQLYIPDPDEEKQIRQALNRVRYPDFVVTWYFELGEDWTGDPAIWIYVIVEDDAPDRDGFRSAVRELRERIQEALKDSGVPRWPFVRIRRASEQRAL
jgi:hypothetical protein